jgi:4-amino-4-deoxychorismate lyase
VTVQLLAILGEGLLDPARAVVFADDAGLTRGDGCFEGCRVVTSTTGDSAVDKLDAHLDRMARSAASMELDFDAPQWRALIASACAAWRQPGEAAMKLVLTRGRPGANRATGLLTISPLPSDYPRQRREGVHVVTLSGGTSIDAYAEAPWLLGGVKTLSYAVNMAALREAARRDADDVIFVSTDGWVLESPISSIVWARGRSLYTTRPGPSGILAGTTQKLLFDRARSDGWQTVVASATVEDLHAADVLWLIGSVRGPVDVVVLDGKHRDRMPRTDAEIRRLAGFSAGQSQP